MWFINMVSGLSLDRCMTEDQIAIYIDQCTWCAKFINSQWCDVVVQWTFSCCWEWVPVTPPDFIWQIYVDLCTNWMYKAVWTDVSARSKFL